MRALGRPAWHGRAAADAVGAARRRAREADSAADSGADCVYPGEPLHRVTSFWRSGKGGALREALDELFLGHREALVRTLFRMVGLRHAAEDLAHEAYLRVSAVVERRPVDHLQGFLYQTARNLAVDHLRRERLRRRFEAEPSDATDVDAPSAAPSPEQAAIDRERLALLEETLAALPARARQVLVLSRVHGWSYPKIAAHLGVSPNTVYNDVRAAMARCLAAVGRTGPR